MWTVLAFASALFAGLTSILAKIGLKDTDSTLATALRTIVVLIFSWLMVFVVGSQGQLAGLSGRTLLFLALSGLATGGSWLCYFRALQLGNVNQVAPIDKSSTILTMLLAFLLLGEPISLTKGIGLAAIGAGTLLMLERKADTQAASSPTWLFFALGSAVFAALTSILGKVGIQGRGIQSGHRDPHRRGPDHGLGHGLCQRKQTEIRGISRRSWLFLVLSGLATGGSWLCYYRALRPAPPVWWSPSTS